jgi:HlyD family secretion protein
MTQKNSQFQAPSHSIGQWLVSFAVAIAMTNGFNYITNLFKPRAAEKTSDPSPPKSDAAVKAVSALGRLEPKGDITKLSAPISLQGTRVGEIKVKEGDRVKKGQVVAILDSNDSRVAALNKAKAEVEIAKARLNIIKAGAKPGDIKAQQEKVSRLQKQLQGEIATRNLGIARLDAESRNADIEADRHRRLYEAGATNASATDQKILRSRTAREQANQAKAAMMYEVERLEIEINEAKAALNSISEVRVVDIKRAEAELNSAIAEVRQAQADLNLTYIKAPVDGQILKVHVRPGEVIDNEGIANIGQTQSMNVVAQVYETDIEQVRVGQKAIITSNAFLGKLSGKVEEIGLQVTRQDAFDDNPLEKTDNRIVEVKISLDPTSSKQVTNLSKLQVQAVILQESNPRGES